MNTRPLFALAALFALTHAAAFEVRPGLYEHSGNTTFEDQIEGDPLPLPPRSPSIWPTRKVCIPENSAAWLAYELRGRLQAAHPEAELERVPNDIVYGRKRAQAYRLAAPLPSKADGRQLLGYTASVAPDNRTDTAAPHDFYMQFTYETGGRASNGKRYTEHAHSNAFYRYLGDDCGDTAPQTD